MRITWPICVAFLLSAFHVQFSKFKMEDDGACGLEKMRYNMSFKKQNQENPSRTIQPRTWKALAERNKAHNVVGQYIEDAVATLKLRIHQASQRHEGTRLRRSVNQMFLNHSTLPRHELIVNSILPLTSLPTKYAVKLHPFKVNSTQYIAVVNSGHNQPKSEIYRMVGQMFQLVQRFPISGCVDFEFGDFGNEKFAIFVQKVGTNWKGLKSYDGAYHVYRFIPPGIGSTSFHHITNIAMHGGTSVKTFLHKGREYFIAANSYAERGNLWNAKSTLHIRTEFGFIKLQEFHTQGAEDVEVFVMAGLVYLVFANHKNNEGMVDIYSTVYRESMKAGKHGFISFEYVQRILTHGARDFEYFSMKNNHYIVVANEFSQLITHNAASSPKRVSISNDYEVDSIIYWWSGRFFVEWQRIPTNGAVRWSSFQGPNKETFLAVANSRSQALIYVYDQIKGLFKPTAVQGVNPVASNSIIPDVRSVNAFSLGNITYLAVANFNESGGFNVFKVNFTYNSLPAAGKTIDEKLKISLSYVKDKLNAFKIRVDRMKQILRHVMTTDRNQTVYGTNTFKDITINNFKANNIIYTQNAVNNPIERAVRQAMRLKQNLTRQNDLLTKLQRRLDDTITKTGTHNITGTKIFTGKVTFKNVTAQNMTVGTIDGVNVTDFAKRVWSKSKPQKITGKNVFLTDVNMLKHINITGKINGIRIPGDVMTTNTEQRVTGKKIFKEDITILGNITMNNFTVNRLRIPEDLVLRGANKKIEGKKSFASPVRFRKFLEVNGLVNGKNLSDFSRRVLTLSTDQIITGKKTFLNGFTVNGNLDVNGLVDGVNLTKLDLDAVRINKNETIKGKKRIRGSVIVEKNVETLSTTNDQRLQDDVMTTTTDQIINGSKKFTNNVYVQGNIITTSTIDGIDLSKDAVTKSGDQTILGKKTFTADVIANGDIVLNGTVDGEDISDLNKNAVKIHGENVITAPKVFTGKISIGNLSITDRINGIRLKELRESILTVNGKHKVTAPMTFESIRILDDLEVNGTLNGVRIPDDLITLTKANAVTKNVTFADDVVFEGRIELENGSKVNGEDLSEFAKSVVLNGTDQIITGKKTFANDVVVKNNISVNGKVNGYIIPSDFVTLNTAQNITGTKTFTRGITVQGRPSAGIISVSTTVNGIDISELPRDVVYREENQTVFGTVTFTGNVTINESVTVGKLVDGVNITNLALTAVRLSKRQNITGKKVFTKDIEFKGPVTSPGLINRVNLRELDSNSLKKTGTQYVSGTKIFEKNIKVAGNINKGTINGISLADFKKRVVTKEGSETIDGVITFAKNISFENLSVGGRIDAVKINELMLTSGDQEVKGYKTFKGGMKVIKGIDVAGKINGVNLTELDKDVMRVSGDQNITGTLIFEKGFTVNGSIDIKGLVNGVDISELKTRAVSIDEENEITGRKIFLKNVTVDGDVEFKKPLNGLNVTEFLSNIVQKSKAQVITAEKTFASPSGVRVASLKARDINVSGLIDNVDLTQLDSNAVKLSSNQELQGEYVFLNQTKFEGNIEVKGRVNDVDIPSDVLLTSGDQFITGKKSFKNLAAKSNINVTGKVDGVDLSEFAKTVVTLSTNQTISGQKSFISDFTIQGNVELPNNGTVNGIDVSEQVLMTDGPVFITGEKTFTTELAVTGDLNVTGLVNGIDVEKLNRDIARVNGKQQLIGKNTFYKDLTVRGNVTVDGYINGFKVEDIMNATGQLKRKTYHDLDKLKATSGPICAQLKVFMNLSGIEVHLSGIERTDKFLLKNGGQLDATTIDGFVFITIARELKSGCGPAYIMRCTPLLKCIKHQVITTQAIHMQFFKSKGKTYILVSHFGKKSSKACPLVSPQILQYQPDTKNFVPSHVITGSLDSSISHMLSNPIVAQNVASLIPTPLINKALLKAPIATLGSEFTQSPPVMTRSFKTNGTTYLLTASKCHGMPCIELFVLKTNTMAGEKLQMITTREVSAFDVGLVNGRFVLAIAEGRLGKDREVKSYMFVEKRRRFHLHQSSAIEAVSLKLTNIHNHHYLVFTNPTYGFGLCEWKGVTGFKNCMSVPDVGIKYMTAISTNDGVYVVGITKAKMVSYKTAFQGVVPKFKGTQPC